MSERPPGVDVDVDVDRLVAAVCEAGGLALGRALIAAGGASRGWASDAAEVVERRLAASLVAIAPGARVVSRRIGEENGGVARLDGPLWVMDAVVGEDDFACGLPLWCVSAGLVTWLGVVAGAVYMPALSDVYLFLDGAATWRTRPAEVAGEGGLGQHSLLLVPPGRGVGVALPGQRRSLGPTTSHMLLVARGVASGGYAESATLGELAVALPFLRAAGGEACYVGGNPVSLSELLDESRPSEPVVFAAAPLLEPLRGLVARALGGAFPSVPSNLAKEDTHG